LFCSIVGGVVRVVVINVIVAINTVIGKGGAVALTIAGIRTIKTVVAIIEITAPRKKL
jgi:hypothetical protein